jgi:hypothetical protein
MFDKAIIYLGEIRPEPFSLWRVDISNFLPYAINLISQDDYIT